MDNSFTSCGENCASGPGRSSLAPSDHAPVIEAVVAHRWFLAIHLFDDGNGHIAGAVADRALLSRGILEREDAGGRSTSYRLPN